MDKTVYLIGIGMGSAGMITQAAIDALKASTVIVGADRMLQSVKTFADADTTIFYSSYIAKEIGNYLRQEDFSEASVVLSGDVGFYSGARKLLDELSDFHVILIPGITSMVYFCSKVKMSWEDICFGSAHGKNLNMIQRIVRHRRCFFLLDGQNSVDTLCDKLIYYGLEHVKLYIGERLSYPDEQIIEGCPVEVKGSKVGNLVVVLTENDAAKDWVARSIPDEEFIRSKVPMTKSEIRTVSIGKLQLTEQAVVYDIGAGSGSVSIEIAMQSPDIQVYSIEKKDEAIQLLEKNKRKFAADNMEIIQGLAPQAMENLPMPTHAFIGGSSGNLEEIIALLFSKNKKCKIVINTIALNSIAEVMKLLEKHPEYESNITQIQSSVSKKVGSYQLMMGQNPIYIISVSHK